MHGESPRQSPRTQIMKVGDVSRTCPGLCRKVGAMEFGLNRRSYSEEYCHTWVRGPWSRNSYRACSYEDPTDARRPLSRPVWRPHARGLSTWCTAGSNPCGVAAGGGIATGRWRSRRGAETCSQEHQQQQRSSRDSCCQPNDSASRLITGKIIRTTIIGGAVAQHCCKGDQPF